MLLSSVAMGINLASSLARELASSLALHRQGSSSLALHRQPRKRKTTATIRMPGLPLSLSTASAVFAGLQPRYEPRAANCD